MSLKKENCKHATDWECPFCEETEEIIIDVYHGEIFCWKCGLILSKNL